MGSFQAIRRGMLAACVVLVTACTSALNPLSISEEQLAGYLREQIVRFDHEQLKSGSPLSVQLRDAAVEVGPEGREVISLAFEGEVAVNAVLTKIPVDVSMKLEGQPFFEPEEQAIYIRRLTLIDSEINSPFFKGDFKPVTDMLMKAVGRMLEEAPVYRLNPDDFSSTLIKMADLDLQVTKGRLVLAPRKS